MSKRTQIRNNIAMSLSTALVDTNVYTDAREIGIYDFPCVFVSTPSESIDLKGHPDLIRRELEVHIQGFISGQNLSLEADKMSDSIENALKNFVPVLNLNRITFEVDVLNEHAMAAILMSYETQYEEKLWNI